MSQVLLLLQLAPETQNVIAARGDPLERTVASRPRSTSLLELPAEEQRRELQYLLIAGMIAGQPGPSSFVPLAQEIGPRHRLQVLHLL